MPVGVPMGQLKLGWITANGWSGTVPDRKIGRANRSHHGPARRDHRGAGRADGSPAEKFEEKNAALLGLADLGPPAVVSNVLLKTSDDFKGKKVRVCSEGQAEVSGPGGAPAGIPFADICSALQHGTVYAAIPDFQGVDTANGCTRSPTMFRYRLRSLAPR